MLHCCDEDGNEVVGQRGGPEGRVSICRLMGTLDYVLEYQDTAMTSMIPSKFMLTIMEANLLFNPPTSVFIQKKQPIHTIHISNR